MANSKAPKAVPEKERGTPSVSARIEHTYDIPDSKLLARASVTIGGAFAVHGLRVYDSDKGPWVQMPQQSYEKDGKKEYSDIFHAVTADGRTAIQDAVLSAYEQKMSQTESPVETEALSQQM